MKNFLNFRLLLVLPASLFLGCGSIINKNRPNPNLKLNDGVLMEQFDPLNSDVNRFNSDNKIFKVGTFFLYEYEHRSKDGDSLLFRPLFDSWEFVPVDDQDSLTIRTVLLEVLDGNPMAERFPDYQQTSMSYKLGNRADYSISGVVENSGNIWLHPPRDLFFEILELNPFPYIKAPYVVGNRWEWDLTIGSLWADARWKMWSGKVQNLYTYEIVEKVRLDTYLGKLKCLKVVGYASSRLGKTKLISYFNKKYGFVRLEYVNIDGSTTSLSLKDYYSKQEK